MLFLLHPFINTNFLLSAAAVCEYTSNNARSMYSPIIIFCFKLRETFRDKSSLAFEHMTGLSATTNLLPVID